MRAQKVLSLDDKRTFVTNELSVSVARQLVARADEFGEIDLKNLLTERFSEMEALLGDCLVPPAGETLDDLSASEAVSVIESFLEVNASFLDLLALLGLVEWVPKTPSPTSTEPVSSSSSADTPT